MSRTFEEWAVSVNIHRENGEARYFGAKDGWRAAHDAGYDRLCKVAAVLGLPPDAVVDDSCDVLIEQAKVVVGVSGRLAKDLAEAIHKADIVRDAVVLEFDELTESWLHADVLGAWPETCVLTNHTEVECYRCQVKGVIHRLRAEGK